MGQTSSFSWLRPAATGCGAVLLTLAVGLVVLVLVDPLCDNHVMADVASDPLDDPTEVHFMADSM